MRALATDNAGNTTASAVQTNRRIDNNGPVVAITNPRSRAASAASSRSTARRPTVPA